jgi:trigger factor
VKVTLEKIAACRRKLTIEVPTEEVDREWKDALKEFQKQVQIPGYRAGRAPIPMLERRFAKEIEDEVRRRLLPQYFREAVAKEKLKVVGPPEIGEIKLARGSPLTFQATLDVAPDFEIPSYKGIKVKRRTPAVKDEQVDEALKTLAEQQATFADVEGRPLGLGDFAVVSYSSVCDGKPLVEIAPNARALSENKQFWLRMDKESFLPGFCEALVGAAKGDHRQVLVDFPADFRIKDLGGKKAAYSVEILGIKERKLPPVDEALAKSYQAESLEKLKEQVRKNLQADEEQTAESEVRNQVIEHLLKTATFDLPESVVAAETQQAMLDIVRENTSRGINPDSLREKGKEIHEFAQKSARDRVKLNFILGRVADTEKIEIKDEEVDQEIARLAQRASRPLGKLRAELAERGADESLRERMLLGRTLDRVVELAATEAA